MWFVEGMLANVLPSRNIINWLKLLVWDTLSPAGATRRLGRERERLFGGGRTRSFLPYLGMCEDAADGRFGLDAEGTLSLRWNIKASLANFLALEAALRELSRALGGRMLAEPALARRLG